MSKKLFLKFVFHNKEKLSSFLGVTTCAFICINDAVNRSAELVVQLNGAT